MNILVTSAGGPAAVGVVKSLKDIRFEGNIVAVDSDPLSVGFHLVDSYHVVPKTDSDSFVPAILDIIKMENIDLILPTGSEILPLTKHVKNVTLFMSDHETIKLCNDKWEFYKKCKDAFDLPFTSLFPSDLAYPLFVKPRMEQGGSRGAQVCAGDDQLRGLNNDCELVYQEILPGQEYTIDVLCDMESNPLSIIPRKRLQTKAGISTKGEIIRDAYIEAECHRMCEFLKLKGPVCLQMKIDDFSVPRFIEVNPRFGGGTYFTTLAGVNFCQIIIDLIEGRKPVIQMPEPITVLRYFEEVVL